MKINYSNMPKGIGRNQFVLRYFFNHLRTWYLFHIKFPWIKYEGFVRVMANTRFAKRDIKIGDNVQFGQYCSVSMDVHFGNNILLAGRVSFVGKSDHAIDIPGQLIWDGKRGDDGIAIVEDDVWIGYNVTIVGGIKIHKGAIVAAGSLVNKDIPSCEIWGGVPAKKIKDRFENQISKEKHLKYLENFKNKKDNN